MAVPYALISLLADGQFHSGEALGAALGVSRSAIWKQLKMLEALQVPLYSVPGRGYRLPGGVELLARERIVASMAESAERLARLDILPEVDSTNRYLLEYARQNPGQVAACLAEYQSAGRGRRGREWLSPFAANLYLSLLWPFQGGAAGLGGLSLGIALAVCQALERIGLIGTRLKWPNDLLFSGRKLGGILLELVGEAGGPCQVVIGIGLNVRMPGAAADRIDQPWIDLSTALGRVASRNQLAGELLAGLLRFLPAFERDGLAPWRAAWLARDAFAGCDVEIRQTEHIYAGRWEGIDQDGAGLVSINGERRRILAGDVSLRRRP